MQLHHKDQFNIYIKFKDNNNKITYNRIEASQIPIDNL